MTVIKQNALPVPESLLTVLRNIEREPTEPMEEMRRIAEAQASMLRKALPGSVHRLQEYLPRLFPMVVVEEVADIPVAGLSYWSGQAWHIQLRKTDAPEARTFTLLHQLKRIIDHPVCQRTKDVTEKDWDSLADYFARRVLTPSPGTPYQHKGKEGCL